MANDRSRPRQSWRPAADPTPRRSLSDPRWRRAELATTPASNRRRRGLRIVGGLAAAATCYALAVWALFWVRPLSPAALYPVAAGYLNNLAIPHNAPGLNALETLTAPPTPPPSSASTRWAWFRQKQGLGTIAPTVNLKGETIWDAGLADIKESTVIVYLTGQAGADIANGAFLFRDDSRILYGPEPVVDSLAKLYVKDVIKALRVRSRQRFLLVLDVTEAPANVPLGMIRNDFDAKLLALEPALIEAGNIVVLASGSDRRPTWTMPDQRETLFGHYVAEGLRGAASRDSGRVDTEGLTHHVIDRVEHWSRQHPRELQTPIVLPRGKSALRFDLVLAHPVPKGGAAVATAADPPLARPAIPEKLVKDLAAHWTTHHEFAGTPSPAAAPQLWRKYRDTLTRYDSLIRVHDPAWASVVDEFGPRLVELENQLRSACEVSLEAASENNLALAAVRGPATTPERDQTADFELIWKTPATVGDKAVAIDKGNWLNFYDDLIGRVEKATSPGDFEKARQVLLHRRNLPRPRPAEAHYLAILLRDMPGDLSKSDQGIRLIRDALRVRRRAELAALGITKDSPSHPELVAPLIADKVARADEARRQAEDLVLATRQEQRVASDQGFATARVLYGEAEAQAATLNQAATARDQAFADLPYYSAWAARRSDPARESAEDSALELVEALEKAWTAVHELAAIVAPVEATTGTPAKSPRIERIGELTRGITATLLQARTQLQSDADHWTGDQPGPGAHSAILVLLDTPFLPSKQRDDLARKLLSPAAEGTRSPNPNQTAGRVGRLALASLGRRWFNDPRAVPLVTREATASESERLAKYNELQRGMENLELTSTAGQTDEDALARAGERIGRAHQGLVAGIARLVEAGLKEGLKDWPEPLQEADRLGRLLVGAQPPRPLDPTRVYRRRLFQRLWLDQARRTLADRFFSEDDDPSLDITPGAKPPYYRAAADAFLADLKNFAAFDGDDPSHDPEVIQFRDELALPRRLTLRGPPKTVVVTDAPALNPRYRVAGPPGSHPTRGRPVVWFTPEADSGVRVDSAQGADRVVVPINPPQSPTPGSAAPEGPGGDWPVAELTVLRVEREAAAPGSTRRPETVPGSFQLEGRFRGEIFHERTKIEVHPIPEILRVKAPRRPVGDVAILPESDLIARYGATQGGALVIVLDCSGSMASPPGQPSKYLEATEAIRQILRRVTRGTTVSLWVFGQAVPPAETVEPADLTIRRVLPPTLWRGNDPSQVDDLMGRIRPPALRPWNHSPIARAMIAAASDFRTATGFKTMLVLTDGRDDCLENEPAPPNGTKPEIATELRAAFKRSDVEVNIVGYKLEDSEDLVRQQFGVIREFRRPGQFYPVGHGDALARTLALALKPTLRYSILDYGNIPTTGQVTLGESQVGVPGFRDLRPGNFRLVVEAGGWSERTLRIHRGDKLMVRLREGDTGVAMERVLWTEKLPGIPEPKDVKGWRLSALKSQATSDGGLSLWAGLEKLADPRELALEMFQAGDVWIEVEPESPGLASFQQRWRAIDTLPAPVHELAVPAWPVDSTEGRSTPARPKIRAWWNPDGEVRPIATLTKAEFGSINEIRDRAILTERGPVVMESVRIEDVPTALAPAVDGRPRRGLFVRLSHPPEEPFWVRPVGLRSEWAEHRHYTTAHKYTAVFWPVLQDEVDLGLDGLELVSVHKFRDDARARGCAVDGLLADSPSTTNVGPIPRPIGDEAPGIPSPLSGPVSR